MVVVKLAAALQCSIPNLLPQSPSSSQPLASPISSHSFPKRCRRRALVFNSLLILPSSNRSSLFAGSLHKRPKSTTLTKPRSASFNYFSDEFALRFHLSDDDDAQATNMNNFPEDIRPSWLERGESAYCSMKKAFSSMVFIIRELHSYTLQMREFLYYEDLQEIVVRVQNEMHASFVWLFQQVFYHTPTLMIYVMLLLANYSVYSMGNTVNPTKVPLVQVQQLNNPIIMFEEDSMRGNKGGSGGGGKVASGTDANEWWFDKRGANMESDYLGTELVYRTALLQEPNNPLLLANYAQFQYLIAQDYDRAEELFKKAIEAKPADGEAYSKYGNFLWKAKNDLWGAEEILLEAIEADPTNSCYIANYAYFLWNTGGEDTCST